jgi:hypothetical protein
MNENCMIRCHFEGLLGLSLLLRRLAQ